MPPVRQARETGNGNDMPARMRKPRRNRKLPASRTRRRVQNWRKLGGMLWLSRPRTGKPEGNAMQHDSRAVLRRIPLFREFSDHDCDAVMSVLRLRQFQAGDVVLRQGSPGDHMVIVLDGRLRVEAEDLHGNKTELGAIQAGEIVGEMAAIDPAPRHATVVAASDAVVYELGRAGLSQLRVQAPGACVAIVSAVIGDVTRRLREMDKRIDRELHPVATKAGRVQSPSQDVQVPVSMFSRIWSRLTGD
jgi:CRP-like cAMP-binding protein